MTIATTAEQGREQAQRLIAAACTQHPGEFNSAALELLDPYRRAIAALEHSTVEHSKPCKLDDGVELHGHARPAFIKAIAYFVDDCRLEDWLHEKFAAPT